jgi:hypothetical protein
MYHCVQFSDYCEKIERVIVSQPRFPSTAGGYSGSGVHFSLSWQQGYFVGASVEMEGPIPLCLAISV